LKRSGGHRVGGWVVDGGAGCGGAPLHAVQIVDLNVYNAPPNHPTTTPPPTSRPFSAFVY